MFDFNKPIKKWLIFWVFGLISIGIVVAMGVILFNLSKKTSAPSSISRAGELDALAKVTEQKVSTDYAMGLNNLLTQVKNSQDFVTAKEIVKKVFFEIRVPQPYLESHLQTWLKIEKMPLETNLSELISVLQELQSQLK